MSEIELLKLRDMAIEYLPAAQKAVEQDRKLNTGREGHFCGLNHAAMVTLGKITSTANERAAAQLLEALSAYEICDEDLRETAMAGIIEAAEQFEEVTGRAIQLKPAKVGTGDTVATDSKKAKEPPPVTADVVMGAFPMITWGDSLSKVSETIYQWLNPAVRYAGNPRPGDAKRFSLAHVAVCLVLGPKKLPRNTAASIIKKHPEWLPEWESLIEYLPKS